MDSKTNELEEEIKDYFEAIGMAEPWDWDRCVKAYTQAILDRIQQTALEARIDELEEVIKNTVRCYYHDDRGRVIETPQTYLTKRREALQSNLNQDKDK